MQHVADAGRSFHDDLRFHDDQWHLLLPSSRRAVLVQNSDLTDI